MSKKNNFSSNHSKNSLILYGRHPVFAAIANSDRQINKIVATADNIEDLKKVCIKNGRSVNIINVLERKEIDKMLPSDAVHQGIVAYCNKLEGWTLEDVCSASADKENCHVLILDQVTDPQNVGAIIRSAVAFDTLALIMQDKNSPEENGAMAKASAGMIEHLPIVRVTNLSRAIEKLKDAGFWVVGMDGYAQITIDKMDKNGKIAVVMGSEGKGMRRLVEENCDTTVKLPISPLTESLNVATACAIALYEINK